MSRYYQVIVTRPLNINPSGTSLSFMPGETHQLTEELGKVVFADGSPYQQFFNLVEIVPPYEQEKEEGFTDKDLEASDTPLLNSLSLINDPLVITNDEDKDEETETKLSEEQDALKTIGTQDLTQEKVKPVVNDKQKNANSKK